MQTGGSFHNLGDKARQQSRSLKRLFSIGGDCDLPVRLSLWMVMGTSRLDCAKWNIPIRNKISRTRHHRCSQPLIHIRHSSELPFPSLRPQVWHLPLLCCMGSHHDHICLLLAAWNQRSPNWRDDPPMEEALVLEKDHARYGMNVRFWG